MEISALIAMLRIAFVFIPIWHLSLAATTVQKDYCVVGAGPGGLQIGYFLERAKRDYIIFERANVSGYFFVHYPRHRKLISINKRHTGRSNKEFNLRHDWNSLLSDDESLLFTKYSDVYFPHADLLLDYLRDYQKKLGISVQFNTDIRDIQYHDSTYVEKCRYTMKDQRDQTYCCKYVLAAPGISKPFNPFIRGEEHMDNYDTMSVDPKDFEGQSVMIIGKGNSGMETALNLYGSAAYVHIVGRDRIKLSWDTHYVGDIRGVNNEILDAYMLKSLDGIFESGVEEMYVVKREDGKLILKSTGFTEINFLDQNPVREGYDRIIRCMGFKWDNSIFHNSSIPRHSVLFPPQGGGRGVHKYPDIGADYQSTQFPGLYFVGTLTHSLDFRKAAGGFIHGFRYTARTLHHILEWTNHGIRWPSIKKPVDQLLSSILKRTNEASGIYQMFQNLGDVVIVDREDGTFEYLEEFPLKLIPKLREKTGHEFQFPRHALIVLSLEYGANFSKAGQDHFGEGRAHGSVDSAHKSNFLHPVIYYYRKLFTDTDLKEKTPYETLPRPDGIHHILEDFTTSFDGPTIHLLPFRRFLEFFLEQDLRIFSIETCITLALTSHVENDADLPLSCRRYLKAEDSVVNFMQSM